MKRRMLFLALVVLVSCSPSQPVFVVNHRDYPVQVVYRAERYFFPPRQYFICALEVPEPMIASTTDPGSFDMQEWKKPAQVSLDESLCEVRFILPGRSSAHIGRNEFCSGDSQYFENQTTSPRLTYLRIESIAGIVEFSGWELARQFVEERGFFSDGECRYDIR